MGFLRIAQAQINTTVGDLSGTIEKITRFIKRARDDNHADIVTLPELAVSGYPPEDLLLKPQFLRDVRNALDEIVCQSRGIVAVVGFPEEHNGAAFNAAALIHDGSLIDIYRKIELPNYGVFDEKRYFVSGTAPLFFQMNSIRIMLTICEDIWIDNGPVERFAREGGADIILNISASPFHVGKLDTRLKIASDFASRTNAYICYTNLVGGEDELVFDGSSMVVDKSGNLLSLADRFSESILIGDFNEGLFATKKNTMCPNAPKFEIKQKKEPWPPMPFSISPALSRVEEVYAALVLGTRDYVIKNGFQKVVIGISGGIDSAVAAAIAKEALGAQNVIGVTMPSPFTSRETFSDAHSITKNLGIKIIEIPIQSIFSAYLNSLSVSLGPGDLGVTGENIQARIRGNILMALSNALGWLVLTTGNKSETAVGYSTLYGDMAGGFSVIKDVPKTLVYELATFINRNEVVIPRSIIDRPPTAELRIGQKDEDSLPPYSLLDPILQAYVEDDKAPDELIADGFPRDAVLRVTRLVDTNEYKRRQAPPGIKITPKAFGKDRRLPITNKYLKEP